MLSLCLFQAFICLNWGGCGWVRGCRGQFSNLISLNIFFSLSSTLSSSEDPSSFPSLLPFHPPPPFFSPLLSATGEILLCDGRPASRGFNPAMEFVIFDNLVMEAGMKALACVNKHRPHTSLSKATEGERKQELRELTLTFR